MKIFNGLEIYPAGWLSLLAAGTIFYQMNVVSKLRQEDDYKQISSLFHKSISALKSDFLTEGEKKEAIILYSKLAKKKMADMEALGYTQENVFGAFDATYRLKGTLATFILEGFYGIEKLAESGTEWRLATSLPNTEKIR